MKQNEIKKIKRGLKKSNRNNIIKQNKVKKMIRYKNFLIYI